MIVFYNKKTGQIVGTISGRVHSEAQMKMWVGDRKENKRVIFQWEPIKKIPVEQEVNQFVKLGVDEKTGKDVFQQVKKKIIKHKTVWGVKHKQKDLLERIAKRKDKFRNYKISLKTGHLIKNTKKRNKLTFKKKPDIIKP